MITIKYDVYTTQGTMPKTSMQQIDFHPSNVSSYVSSSLNPAGLLVISELKNLHTPSAADYF